MLVNCRNVATTASRDSEVRLVAVHDFKWRMLQCRLYAAVDREFSYWEKCGPVILPLSGEESEVLLDLLVHTLSLPICPRVVYSR